MSLSSRFPHFLSFSKKALIALFEEDKVNTKRGKRGQPSQFKHSYNKFSHHFQTITYHPNPFLTQIQERNKETIFCLSHFTFTHSKSFKQEEMVIIKEPTFPLVGDLI
jgi:hypothetical protein